MQKEIQVIMLPTDSFSVLYKTDKLYYYTTPKENGIGNCQNQHLYFISDDSIKEGDWCIDQMAGEIFKMGKQADVANRFHHGNNKKIIATSNPELWTKTKIENTEGHFLNKPLPKISSSFIEEYVNKQGKTDKVMLEYEGETRWDNKTYIDNPVYIPKLTSNGEVIVVPSDEKKMYTRDEVKVISGLAWKKAFEYGMNEIRSDNPKKLVRANSFDLWFNENY